ncbi:murein biosynthesis integral membrane protein MurJ [Candidatus Microgenomates bacterium]|nr:murein biosynthesis integral membrane protein MurJ [Candidatus Microgenomates bacterium]
MKKVLRNGLLFLDLPQGDILSAGFVIMFLAMLSGVFGLIRDRLLAANFTPDLVGIYFASFVIPDNIFQVFILSAVGVAFIPVFSKYQKQHEEWRLARSVLNASLLFFLIITVIIIVLTKPLSFLIVPGLYKENAQHIDLLVNLTRIILLAQPFFVLSYFCTGVLQSYQRFLVPASASLFYNIGIILGILFLAPVFGMYGVALGIILGAFLHFAIQVVFVWRLGFSYNFDFRVFHPGVLEIVRLMIPRSISIAIERAKLTVDTILASVISLSSITYLNFALHVAVFPVSLVAASVAQAAFPFFAQARARGDMEEFKKHLRLSLIHIIFLLAPASVLLVIFHTPIVRLVFGAPLFSWTATVLTAQTLAILSLGLIAQGLSNILARGFYALFDTKTPLIMTVISITTTIALSLFFVLYLKLDVRALAVSTTVGSFINAMVLFILLNRKIGSFLDARFMGSLIKIFFMSALLAVVSYAMLKLLEQYFNTSFTLTLLLFTVLVALISSAFYLLLSFLFNLSEYKELFLLFQKAGAIHKRLTREN